MKRGIEMLERFQKYRFLFEELVKRDFKVKYKGTFLGVVWSILSPLLNFLVMKIVFTEFFGRTTAHYSIFLFSGNIIYAYFSEATRSGMMALRQNANIISKVNVPKYLFIFAKNVQTFISFLLNIVVFFIFVALDDIPFSSRFFMLIFPIISFLIFNIGCGLILSALYMFFMDMRYLYDVVLRIVLYMSAIFYNVEVYSLDVQRLFLLNPIYVHIKYLRCIVIDGIIPSFGYHVLMIGVSLLTFLVGALIYKKYNNKFLYYI